MSEFDPPKGRRQRQRVQNVRTILGGFEHERQVHERMNAIDATQGHSEEWYQARENLYDFYARYGKPAVEASDDSRRWDVV